MTRAFRCIGWDDAKQSCNGLLMMLVPAFLPPLSVCILIHALGKEIQKKIGMLRKLRALRKLLMLRKLIEVWEIEKVLK